MQIGTLIGIVPLFGLLTWAALSDLQSRRIPNWLTVALATMGLAQSFAQGFVQNFLPVPTVTPLDSAVGLFLGFILNIGLFVMGVRGGGDVKLYAAVGAWLGARDIVMVFLMGAILDMVWAVTQCAVQGRLKLLASNTLMLAGSMKRMGSLAEEDAPDGRGSGELIDNGNGQVLRSAGKRLPCAVPLLAATVVVLMTGRFLQWPF